MWLAVGTIIISVENNRLSCAYVFNMYCTYAGNPVKKSSRSFYTTKLLPCWVAIRCQGLVLYMYVYMYINMVVGDKHPSPD